MKKILSATLLFLLALVGGVSCKTDIKSKSLSALLLNPTQLSMFVGEEAKIEVQWTPSDAKPQLTFAVDNDKVVSVNDKGVVKALAEGNATLTVKAENQTASCTIIVSGKKADKIANELPLMKFVEINKDGKIDSPEILQYEASLGREGKFFTHDGIKLYGFVNEKMLLIPCVAYGFRTNSGESYNMALSRETVENCPKTLLMLQKWGFSDAKVTVEKGKNLIMGTYDLDPKIQVLGANFTKTSDIEAGMELLFLNTRKEIPQAHKVLTSVVDFPSWKALSTSSESIKDFESRLKLRELDEDESGELNLLFKTKKESKEHSNFTWVFYLKDTDEGYPFINATLNCIKSNEDICSDEFKQWLATNGFDRNFKWDEKYEEAVIESSDGKLIAAVSINMTYRVCYLQIVEASSWKSLSFRKHAKMISQQLLARYQ